MMIVRNHSTGSQAAQLMRYSRHKCTTFGCTAEVSFFSTGKGPDEVHLMFCPQDDLPLCDQLLGLARAYEETLALLGLDSNSAIFRRFFVADPACYLRSLESLTMGSCDLGDLCAISLVGQTPKPPAAVAMWAYHISDPEGPILKHRHEHGVTLIRKGVSHHWVTALVPRSGTTAYDQTYDVFRQYNEVLAANQMSLSDNVLRTWLFVDGIDSNYRGLVDARRDLFAQAGLVAETHFIASTGIEGRSLDGKSLITMDAWAATGLVEQQVRFLTAEKMLGPTHVYGATFERGTSVAYRDRKHVIISGTASIDHNGEIVHEHDVVGQLRRTLENIAAILRQAEATFDDIVHLIVYVRDPADREIITDRMRMRFPQTPMLVVLAHVCRPGWLVEVEGIAVVPTDDPSMPAF